MHGIASYPTVRADDDVRKRKFFFESTGNASIIKVVEYTAIQQVGRRAIYNLGFGDYDEATSQVTDSVNSNNGDMRRVFGTVLSTVPLFFAGNPDDVIVVQGSDSDDATGAACWATCRKNCVDSCKNIDRRIKTYRYFVDKSFATLTREYVIFGSYRDALNKFVQYVVGEDYAAILVYKKN